MCLFDVFVYFRVFVDGQIVVCVCDFIVSNKFGLFYLIYRIFV